MDLVINGNISNLSLPMNVARIYKSHSKIQRIIIRNNKGKSSNRPYDAQKELRSCEVTPPSKTEKREGHILNPSSAKNKNIEKTRKKSKGARQLDSSNVT